MPQRQVLSTHSLVIDIPGRRPGMRLELSLAAGELWGVLGPNGAGKTTLLHTLAGLRAAASGEVRLEGRPLASWRRREMARKVAVVFQEHHDTFPSTVLESALIGRHPHRTAWEQDTAEDLRIVHECLQRLELRGTEHRLVSTLSGGERQRLAIAAAMAQQPLLWLLDEPTNHLDLHHQVAVMNLLAEHAGSGGTVFVCLHDLNLAARWCDRLLLLHADGAARWGTARELLDPHLLGDLYGMPLELVRCKTTRVFIPAIADRAAAGQPSSSHRVDLDIE